jgi:hypothetical protein
MEAKSRRLGAALLAAAFALSPALASASTFGYARSAPILYQNLALPNGNTAIVFTNGMAQVFTKDHRKVETVLIRNGPQYDGGMNSTAVQLPDKGHIIAQLAQGTLPPFVPNRVVVVYRDGVSAPQDIITVDKPTLRAMREAVAKHATASMSVPSYTTDSVVNRTLGTLGVDRSERLFRQFNRSTLSALRSRASSSGSLALDFSNAYRLHISAASVRDAVQTLAKLPQVAYVSPDWAVSTMHTATTPLDAKTVQAQKNKAIAMMYRPRTRTMSLGGGSTGQSIPSNYAIASSAQSFLNAPSTDAVGAYDELTSIFNQLPGQGEIITNVSLGDLDDASEVGNSSDPCSFYAQVYGPTTEIINGQRYLNLPSMPLIPTYTADESGNLNPTGSVCGVDPYLDEIGLDFSVMAPLPHNQQRAGEQGSGDTDLLGIAPGASYRLVVPGEASASISDIDAAFLGAALQNPRPNVISASLGFGEDVYGFPARYLEEDPLTEAVIAAIVQSYNIVVCIASGDGTRTYTEVAIGPSGGSAPTDVTPSGGTPTNLADDFLSTIPSEVFDSGSIDVGGTTTDDIFSNPPQYAFSPQVVAQHAYAETRWTGQINFSSGFGTRVNVSSPSDNILSFEHTFGGTDDAVTVVLNGGTSASAPATAAAAAVVLQTARLTNSPMNSAESVRDYLADTGSPVPNVSQADRHLRIGPQIDVKNAVETMLERPGGAYRKLVPAAPRVAVEQRVDYTNLNGAFLSATDPTDIDLSNGPRAGADWLMWITIAPDWEFVPKNARYELIVKGSPRSVIATTPWARVLPATIFNAAKLTPGSSSSQSTTLTYEAMQGNHVVASVDVPLTFGPAPSKEDFILAPNVPSVVTGNVIPVTYDLTNVGDLNNPELLVSEPGRTNPDTGTFFHPIITMPLSQTKGTVLVPVSSLQGGGIYGIGIENNSTDYGLYYSNFAFTRVAPTDAHRPAAPMLSANGSTPGHNLQIPYGASFQVSYDVSNVPRANGAELEISAAGPGAFGIYNPFNNPNGSIRDHNGIDSGSVYYIPVSGTQGTVTVNGATAGLYAALNHVVRVIPTSGGMPVGEGGDVSTVSMNGVFALDGGYANNGFGVDANGTDGFLTSGQQLASGEIITSLETFSQATQQITQDVASGSNSLYYTMGWGIYGSDVGLFCDENESTFASTCNLLNTVANGTIGNAWTIPAAPSSILEGAANSANTNATFLGASFTTSTQYQLLTSSLTSNTTTSLYNVNPTGPTTPEFWGVAEDTNLGAAGTAVMPYDDLSNTSAPPGMELVDLATGKVTQFTGDGVLFPYGIAVDSATHVAAVPTLGDAGLTFYNLQTQTGTEVIMPQCPPGNNIFCLDGGLYTAADQVNHRFLVEQTAAPDFALNNNSLSQVVVYDESGNVLESVERFDLWGTFLPIQDNLLQLNPNSKEGYLIGPGEQQIIPFNY